MHRSSPTFEADAPLDFDKFSPVAVTLDKLLRQCHQSALPSGEEPGLTARILKDLGSTNPQTKTARWKELSERVGGLNSTLVMSFELLAQEAILAKDEITRPRPKMMMAV